MTQLSNIIFLSFSFLHHLIFIIFLRSRSSRMGGLLCDRGRTEHSSVVESRGRVIDFMGPLIEEGMEGNVKNVGGKLYVFGKKPAEVVRGDSPHHSDYSLSPNPMLFSLPKKRRCEFT
jgi:hypothetical protein